MKAIEGVAAAYSSTGGAWQRGPGRVYDRMAEVLVAHARPSLAGLRVLDVGAGTGAATRALLAAGSGPVVAVDAAAGMLAHGAASRPPAAVADARDLPFATGRFGAAVAAFCLNHLTDPAAGLREMARVTRRGGVLLAATYAADDTHPVKAAVEAALAARGWAPEPWQAVMRSDAIPLLATPERCLAVARAAGLDAWVEAVRVPFPDLGVEELVGWRLGMAQHAPFVATLAPAERTAAAREAAAGLAGAPPLERSMLVFGALNP